MRTKTRFATAGIMLFAVVMPAIAQTPNCAGITDDKARLACYDRGARPKEKAASPQLIIGTMDQERLGSYRSRLETLFLESGISADVMVETNKASGPGGGFPAKYPKLIIWTYLSKAAVYKLITSAKVLDGAKEAGFKMVQFTDKGHDGQWFFDLTKPGSCDRGLCWTN